MNSTVTHVAGLDINARGRIIQRCAVCGWTLCDSAGAVVMGGDADRFPTWQTGRLVRTTVGENPRRYELLDESDELPDDSCIELVE